MRVRLLCWTSSMRARMSSNTLMASSMFGPLLSITHSARCPAAASVISARGLACLGERLQNLSRPKRWHVRGFTQRENLPRDLGKPFKTKLDRQVTAGDHDAQPGVAHCRHHDGEQILKSLPGLDLQH
jgi:hypothetical protein